MAAAAFEGGLFFDRPRQFTAGKGSQQSPQRDRVADPDAVPHCGVEKAAHRRLHHVLGIDRAAETRVHPLDHERHKPECITIDQHARGLFVARFPEPQQFLA
nr:hypothetical protein [Candidatus Laterigemmans baculatus]